MKCAITVWGLLVGSVLSVSAQGTSRFRAVLAGSNEVPPSSDPTTATANLSLDGNSLSFFLFVPSVTFKPISGSINGPAVPGIIAPKLFDLGGSTFVSGSSTGGAPPGYRFFSPLTEFLAPVHSR
jgi:hypothetical protein